MANALEISAYLDGILKPGEYEDQSQNGLQVEAKLVKVRKIGAAVNSGLSIIEKALNQKCQILVVHHGLFWKSPFLLNGVEGLKIRKLIEGKLSLYASHLPLDGHLKFGNAALLAKFLGLGNIQPFFRYGSNHIGVKASSKRPLGLAEIADKCKKMTGAIEPLILPFGRKEITKIGILTGSGSSAIEECAKEKLDLLISGEAKQHAYHLAKELELNVIFAGHYATETFGVEAVAAEAARKFGVKSAFINEPTGI